MTAPCAHCGVDHQGEQRYAALPGWHDWTRDTSSLARYVNGGWLALRGLGVVRNDTGRPIVVTRPATPGATP